MEGFDLELEARPAWRDGDYSHIPFWVYSDAANYEAELRNIYKGPVWNYLCLTAELPGNGDYKATKIGETPVLVVRGEDGVLRGFLNRCSHRGALLCLEPRGSVKRLTCIYHACPMTSRATSETWRSRTGRTAGAACPTISTSPGTVCGRSR